MSAPDAQIDLFAWVREKEAERERVRAANAERARNRGYLVFATDPKLSPEAPCYCQVFATEARTPNKAAAKVRPLTSGRRLHVYLATGKYKDELADARWVA